MIALDTNVMVDLVRQIDPVRTNYQRALNRAEPLVISTVVLKELVSGVEASGRRKLEKIKLDRVLAGVKVIPFEVVDAEVGGRLQAEMKRLGRKAPSDDFIVGSHAVARGATLVTANTRHFENIPGLKLLNWRLPPEEQDTSRG